MCIHVCVWVYVCVWAFGGQERASDHPELEFGCLWAVMGMLETELGSSERRASDHSHQAISHFWNILTGKMGYLNFIAERFDLVFET